MSAGLGWHVRVVRIKPLDTEMPGLRAQMNDALLELVYDDPLNAWEDIPVLELTGPLDGRLDAVLAALGESR